MDDPLINKFNDLKRLYKSKSTFTEEENHQIKIAVKELLEKRSDTKQLAPPVKSELAQQLKFIELQKGQVLIDPKMQELGMYFLSSGSLKMSLLPPEQEFKEENLRASLDQITAELSFQQFQPPYIFGDLDFMRQMSSFHLSHKVEYNDFRGHYLYACQDNTSIFFINHEHTYSIVSKAAALNKRVEFQQLLEKLIPPFKSKIASHKRKISALFQEMTLQVGQKLIYEGQPSTHLYLIKTGLCKIMAEKLTIAQPRHNANHTIFLRDLMQNKSYFSKTTNSFQLGVFGPGEWIGDEILLFLDKPVPYTVVATQLTQVYYITKEQLLGDMPKDVQNYFENSAKQKIAWFEKRVKAQIKNVSEMSDHYYSNIKERSEELLRKFPMAGSNALYGMRNTQYLTEATTPPPELSETQDLQFYSPNEMKNQKTFILQDFAEATCISGVPTILQIDQKPYLNSRNAEKQKNLMEWQNMTKRDRSSSNIVVDQSRSQVKPMTAQANVRRPKLAVSQSQKHIPSMRNTGTNWMSTPSIAIVPDPQVQDFTSSRFHTMRGSNDQGGSPSMISKSFSKLKVKSPASMITAQTFATPGIPILTPKQNQRKLFGANRWDPIKVLKEKEQSKQRVQSAHYAKINAEIAQQFFQFQIATRPINMMSERLKQKFKVIEPTQVQLEQMRQKTELLEKKAQTKLLHKQQREQMQRRQSSMQNDIFHSSSVLKMKSRATLLNKKRQTINMT